MSEPGTGRYTHGHHESVLRAHRRRTAENSAAYLLAHLRPGMSLLDVGCGPATITADLARLVAPGRVLAIDPAPDVLGVARAELDSRGALSVEVRLGDVYALVELAGQFDVVHAHQVLQHVPDPVAALRAMGRAARPGGLVAARDADYAAMTWFPQIPELQEWLSLYRRIARANGGEPDAGRRMHSWARAAGFAEVTAGASAWCFATEEDRQWWGELWAERVGSSALASQLLDAGLATRAELDRIAAAWREWAQAPDGWFAVLHGEILCRVDR